MGATGHPSAEIPASSSTSISFGTIGSILLAVENTSLNAQTASVAMYDAPSIAAYNANPTNWKLLYQAKLSGGQILDMTIETEGDALVFGCVSVPSGPANSDGGWLFIYD